MGRKKIELEAGQQYHRWTLISEVADSKSTKWLARCSCGTKKAVTASTLAAGRSKSCGCLRVENATAALRKHGMTRTRAYRIWSLMKDRCLNPKAAHFPDYGGRGIQVCKRWRDSFTAFHKDMGDPPAGLTLDRVNNDGDYEPGNCRWATRRAQAENRRSTRLLTWGGRTQSIKQWAAELGLHPTTLGNRLRSGWPVEKALTTPVHSASRSSP